MVRAHLVWRMASGIARPVRPSGASTTIVEIPSTTSVSSVETRKKESDPMHGLLKQIGFELVIQIEIAKREARALARLKGQGWASHPGARRADRNTARR